MNLIIFVIIFNNQLIGLKDKGGLKLIQALLESDSFPAVNRVVIKRLLGILQRYIPQLIQIVSTLINPIYKELLQAGGQVNQ